MKSRTTAPMKRFIHSFFLFLTLTVCLQAADENAKTYTDPHNVDDPDFAVQGEYRGEIGDDPWGVQLVALGDGAFSAVGYPGGLPGDGWDGDKANRRKATGTRDDEGIRFTLEGGESDHRGLLKDGKLQVIRTEDEAVLGTLEKVERKSETLGAKPPEKAEVLFDGSGIEGWDPGRQTEDGLLMQGATSKERFQDFTLHLEFRTPYKPHARGQERGNSGFYAQGRYEVQILDSFGLEGEQNECGGIYSVGAPSINMCFPPLSWQTYDIDFTAARFDDEGKKTANARITVRHNGVVIHDDIEADHATTASPLAEGPEPGPVFLQDHGNPVRFRNIWVVRKP